MDKDKDKDAESHCYLFNNILDGNGVPTQMTRKSEGVRSISAELLAITPPRPLSHSTTTT